MQKAREISEKINQYKRSVRVNLTDDQDIEGLDFEIMSEYFPKLRREIMNTNESISYEFATSIGQLLTDDLKVSEWMILREFIEGKKEITEVYSVQCWDCKENIKYTNLHSFCPECLTSL